MNPKNLKGLGPYLGAANELTKFIPQLVQSIDPFRDLLKKKGTWETKEHHSLAFVQVQKSTQEINNLSPFSRSNQLPIVCDASQDSLGALLMQKNEKKHWGFYHEHQDTSRFTKQDTPRTN